MLEYYPTLQRELIEKVALKLKDIHSTCLTLKIIYVTYY